MDNVNFVTYSSKKEKQFVFNVEISLKLSVKYVTKHSNQKMRKNYAKFAKRGKKYNKNNCFIVEFVEIIS